MSEVELTGNLLLVGGQGQAIMSAPATKAGDDEALVEAVSRGDHDAFGRLYNMYAPMVHGILLARVPRSEVDDLVQDIFLVTLKKLHTLRDHASFGAWLAMITRNRATDFYRRTRETEELPEEIAQRNPLEMEATEILEVIRSLPDTYRETLVLRLVEGMTGPEIAERTGLKAASVRVNLHRGLKLLRERLGMTK
jgi:RNA polymerase sigma-70 factor (ECF subfamily)